MRSLKYAIIDSVPFTKICGLGTLNAFPSNVKDRMVVSKPNSGGTEPILLFPKSKMVNLVNFFSPSTLISVIRLSLAIKVSSLAHP